MGTIAILGLLAAAILLAALAVAGARRLGLVGPERRGEAEARARASAGDPTIRMGVGLAAAAFALAVAAMTVVVLAGPTAPASSPRGIIVGGIGLLVLALVSVAVAGALRTPPED